MSAIAPEEQRAVAPDADSSSRFARGSTGPPRSVEVVSRADLDSEPHWASAFAGRRKDHRYYELVEDTLAQGFEHGYLAIRDARGQTLAIQPFFVLDQDLVLAVGPGARNLIGAVRRVWPRCMMARTLMLGCAAGEGHLDGDPAWHDDIAHRIAAAIVDRARDLGAGVIVLKEFPAEYRASLQSFLDRGFTRVPSMPMTRLDIRYADFDDYMRTALNSATRRKLRKKFRDAAQAPPLEMTVVPDLAPDVDEAYPLYLQVYERSRLRFERLTPDFFRQIGRRMPDKTSFFIWRQHGRMVAFSLCMFEGEAFYPEYVGFDYRVAFQLHLYHCVVRDMISWAIAHGFKQLRSSGLNYDPKLHLRHRLDPIDLYVRHRSPVINTLLKHVLPWIEPTRFDPILKLFPNYNELWAPD